MFNSAVSYTNMQTLTFVYSGVNAVPHSKLKAIQVDTPRTRLKTFQACAISPRWVLHYRNRHRSPSRKVLVNYSHVKLSSRSSELEENVTEENQECSIHSENSRRNISASESYVWWRFLKIIVFTMIGALFLGFFDVYFSLMFITIGNSFAILFLLLPDLGKLISSAVWRGILNGIKNFMRQINVRMKNFRRSVRDMLEEKDKTTSDSSTDNSTSNPGFIESRE